MYIQSTIPNITSSVISLYAVMDNWCDRFDTWAEVLEYDPHFADVFITINSVNEFLLASLEHITTGKQLSIDNSIDPAIMKDDAALAEFLRSNNYKINTDIFNDYNGSQVRDHLRNQLYRYLVLLEQVEMNEYKCHLNEIIHLLSVTAGIAARINTRINQTRLTY